MCVEHDVSHRATATGAIKECKEQTARKPVAGEHGPWYGGRLVVLYRWRVPVELRPQPDYRQGNRPQRLLGGHEVAKKKAKRKVAKKAAKKKVAKRKKKKARRAVC